MTLAFQDAPIPLQDAIARIPPFKDHKDPRAWANAGQVTDPWIDYLTRVVTVVEATPTRVSYIEKRDQSASIAPTDFSGGALPQGLYRVTYYLRIVQAATTSSSIQATLAFTDRGTALSISGAALTANTVTTFQGLAFTARVDNATPLTYSTTYASVGATPLLYDIAAFIEEVRA
jgi:hypothetical protein